MPLGYRAFIVAGSHREYRDYLTDQWRTLNPIDSTWVEGVHSLRGYRRDTYYAVLTGSYRSRRDWPEIEAELRARRATVTEG